MALDNRELDRSMQLLIVSILYRFLSFDLALVLDSFYQLISRLLVLRLMLGL